MADITIRDSLKARASNPVTGAGPREGMIVEKRVAMLDFDMDGSLATSSYLTLIPASENPNGLIIMDIKGFATEVVAQDSTVAILTVRDNASSPNTLDTLTVTDADAVGDFVADTGTNYVKWESLVDGTSYSAQHVAAGLQVECAITTAGADAGTVTGRILVMVEFVQIPSNRD